MRKKQPSSFKGKKATPWARSIHPSVNDDLRQHLGIFILKKHGGQIIACHRKDPFRGVFLDKKISQGLQEGDVVVYTLNREQEFKLIKNLGSIHLPATFSLMGTYGYHLPFAFSDQALSLASQGIIPNTNNEREDLRHLPLVTIDGLDAKDFDDAVYAKADPDPKNSGGWQVVVAIADVSFYVQPGDALDIEARKRGNSVYFVDRVIPMLPECLSNDLCSLRPNEDRACIAVEMIITKDGKLKSYQFKRGLMRSQARLTYDQVENALQGIPDPHIAPLIDTIIKPLYGCYQSLKEARTRRGTINVETIENTFTLAADGTITSVQPKKRLESHQLIEELMIAANVAAAKTLQSKDWPCVYRIHEHPKKINLQNLYTLAKNLKIATRKFNANNTIGAINELLQKVAEKPYFRLFNELVLRSQAQARYSPTNVGHFGLNLASYCHFTSPIRRYADLLVHRSLVAALELDGRKHIPHENLEDICTHISRTERIAIDAEREVQDRYMAHYLKDHLGQIFNGTIIGVSIPGLFIEIDNIGAQGFIPKQDLKGDFFIFKEVEHCYFGKRTKKIYRLGDRVKVIVTNADPTICSIGLAIHEEEKEKSKSKFKSKPKKKSFSSHRKKIVN